MIRRITVLAATVLLIMGVFAGCGGTEQMELSLQEFTTLTFLGNDTKGTVSGEILTEDFIAYILQEQPKRKEAELRANLPQITIVIDPNEALTNGDEVKVSYELAYTDTQTIDKTLLFVDTPYTVLAEHLVPFEEVDIFDYLQLDIVGEGESAEIALTNTYPDEPLKSILFQVSGGSELAFDSEVTFIAIFDAEEIEAAGYRITTIEKDVKTSERPEPAASQAAPAETPIPEITPPTAPSEDDAPVNLNDEVSEGGDEPMEVDPNSPALGMDPGADIEGVEERETEGGESLDSDNDKPFDPTAK